MQIQPRSLVFFHSELKPLIEFHPHMYRLRGEPRTVGRHFHLFAVALTMGKRKRKREEEHERKAS